MSKKKEIEHIKENMPNLIYSEELNCFIYQEDGYCMDIYQIRAKDLVNSDVDEIEMDCFKWAKFYKTYGDDVEIISLMFPCDTGIQQRYWKKRMEANLNPEFKAMIERKVQELEWREKHTATKEFYLMFFFESAEAVPQTTKMIESVMETGPLGLIDEIPREKKELILFKLANKNSQIF